MLWNLYIWRSSELGWERSQPNHEQRLGLKEVPPSLPLLYDFLRENILKTTMKETAFNLIIAAFSAKIAKSSLIKTLLSWRHSWFFHSFQTPYSISSRKKWSKFIHSFPWCMPAKKKKKKSSLYSWLTNSRLRNHTLSSDFRSFLFILAPLPCFPQAVCNYFKKNKRYYPAMVHDTT